MKQGKNTNSKMTSIARKINMEFWLRELADFLFLDFVLLLVVAGSFFVWREGAVPEDYAVAERYFTGDDYYSWQYVIESANGFTYSYPLFRFLDLCKVPAIVLAVVEAIILFSALFSTRVVRKRMKPLHDIAIQTEELSNLSYEKGGIHLENIEQAISELNPDMPDAKIMTGDKELQSLEIAINNLLERMRESRRQQERFVSDASHELRTPIAVIQGYVNMLDRWGKEDEQILKEAIEALKNESEHMKNLIEQLLFLARGDSGRNTLRMEEFNLTEIVEDVMDESLMIDEKHTYRFTGDGDIITVKGDMAMIKQSLRIFVQNASKYSAEGDEIILWAGMLDGRPAYSVQDEGIGMESSEVIHIFERFYRSDQARSSSFGGTGLGLSIAKWIIDAHNGVIEVLSRSGFGTRIVVKL